MVTLSSPPLHRGRVLACRGRALADLLQPAQRAIYSRCQRPLSMPRTSSRGTSTRNQCSNSCSADPALAAGQGQRSGASGTMKRATARVGLALGGAALLVIAAALAREGQLPESFSEWDDKVRQSLNINKRGAITCYDLFFSARQRVLRRCPDHDSWYVRLSRVLLSLVAIDIIRSTGLGFQRCWPRAPAGFRGVGVVMSVALFVATTLVYKNLRGPMFIHCSTRGRTYESPSSEYCRTRVPLLLQSTVEFTC